MLLKQDTNQLDGVAVKKLNKKEHGQATPYVPAKMRSDFMTDTSLLVQNLFY